MIAVLGRTVSVKCAGASHHEPRVMATSTTQARVIVRAIIDMATGLRMATLAEGVETPDELEALRAEGCTLVQGYLVAPPLPVEQVEPFLARHAASGLAV